MGGEPVKNLKPVVPVNNFFWKVSCWNHGDLNLEEQCKKVRADISPRPLNKYAKLSRLIARASEFKAVVSLQLIRVSTGLLESFNVSTFSVENI